MKQLLTYVSVDMESKNHFVRFSIGQVYNKVKDKQTLLNFINFTSLGSFISLNGDVVFNRHEITIFPK